MKKAQTEMLGIAIVVILVSIGILFIVTNAIRSSGQQTQKREYSEKQLATNILASILSTSTDCQNDRVSTLMIDCGKCYDGGAGVAACRKCFLEDGEEVDVCTYLANRIDFMLNSTLKVWNKKYQFLAYTSPASMPPINITNSIDECLSGEGTGLQYVQKDSYYLPLYPGTMTVELALCS